ncbi:acyl carrier protein [Streptomyces noursei]|uniref:acyl carrier protein n=1 Tax=Streptomyces noursei TaxID=1971 RepID=UPI0016737BB3|nr:acyl carrier protein [Streptomyces noursei]MCZ1013096.1 acyl carrier protein [Streptomyces noursei]GGX55265.1 hypothetical protein GCM10010341_90240 [Streptomyces noursei]
MPTSTYDMLVTKLVDSLGVDPEAIRPEATFADLEVDSLAALELEVICESDLDIKLGLDQLKDSEMNLSQFVAHVEKLLEQRQSVLTEGG